MFYYLLRYTISVLSTLLFHRHVIGRENIPQHSACIVVANHVNLLDSPILGVSLGRRVFFMAKEELFQSSVTGWLAEQFGAFAVAKGRLNRRAGRKALELLAHGQVLIIFPEGKRSYNGNLGQAYPGAALLAIKSGVPIIPVGISGTRQLTGKWWFRGRPRITINIGRPLRLSNLHDKFSKEETGNFSRNIMINIAKLLPQEYRGNYDDLT